MLCAPLLRGALFQGATSFCRRTPAYFCGELLASNSVPLAGIRAVHIIPPHKLGFEKQTYDQCVERPLAEVFCQPCATSVLAIA
jgi:hypothetical protein